MTRIERAIQKLVRRYFERSNEEVVMYNVLQDCNSGEFDRFTSEQIREIAIEAISRLEGEAAIETAIQVIEENYNNFEVFFTFQNGETILI